MRPSPLLSAAAVAALFAAVAGPATAATSPSPARGIASSSVTLLSVAAGGHTVSAGGLELLSDMLGSRSAAKILLTPLSVDGTTYGQQTVTPAESPQSSPSVGTSTVAPALSGVIGLSSPVLQASAADADGEPSTSAGASSLGGLEILGLPVALDGELQVGSAVTKLGGAAGEKTVVVKDLALPSIADLLAALGLDLKALPIGVLTELLTELDLVTPAVEAADKALREATAEIQAQIDAAQAEVDKAAAALAAETDKLAGKNSELAAAEQELATRTADLQPLEDTLTAEQGRLAEAQAVQAEAKADYDSAYATVKAAADLLGLSVSDFVAANSTLDIVQALAAASSSLDAADAAVTSADAAVAKATSDLAAAQSLVDAAQAAVDLLEAAIATLQATIDRLQKVLDDAIAALRELLKDVQSEIDALLAAVLAVLDGTPLVSFDSLSVLTQATATSNKEGGQSAQVIGGELAGLRVLGTDVLDDVLNTGSVDLLDLTGTQLEAINDLIGDLTGTLSGVLSTVPQFPTLSIPAPQVALLTSSTGTGVSDGFGTAATTVRGLSIALPSVRIPTALALPDAAELPALQGIAQVAGLLTSAPVQIDLATLTSNARFAPAVTAAGTPAAGTPVAGTPVAGPQLPRTGVSQALAVLGTVLLGAAYAVRRRRAGELVD
ncbi:MAG: hypothetical protein WD794_10600 [Mycobacteriales bacterium]